MYTCVIETVGLFSNYSFIPMEMRCALTYTLRGRAYSC